MLAGSPGNKEMSGDEVLDYYLQGDVEPVRNNLELQLINTRQIYQRWQLVNGKIDQSAYESEKQLLLKVLQNEDKKHLKNYAAAEQN